MRTTWSRSLALVPVVVTLLAQGAVAQRELPLALVALTSPVSPGHDARITVHTAPQTQCMLLVRYRTGASSTQLALPKRAGETGLVTWTWRVGAKAVRGTWPIIVHCSDEFKGNVVQRRLDTSFVVR